MINTETTDAIIDKAFKIAGFEPPVKYEKTNTGDVIIVKKEHLFVNENGLLIWYFYCDRTSDPWGHSYNKIIIRYESKGKWRDKNVFLKNITTEKVVKALKNHIEK
jgi:hypothetical protein